MTTESPPPVLRRPPPAQVSGPAARVRPPIEQVRLPSLRAWSLTFSRPLCSAHRIQRDHRASLSVPLRATGPWRRSRSGPPRVRRSPTPGSAIKRSCNACYPLQISRVADHFYTTDFLTVHHHAPWLACIRPRRQPSGRGKRRCVPCPHSSPMENQGSTAISAKPITRTAR